MTAPVPKRADQLVLGDRIAHYRLPSTYAEGPGEVVYVKAHTYRGHQSVFVAYVHEDGYYDSTAYLPDGLVEVHPADDDEVTQPIAGRVPAEAAGGLVEIDPPEGFVPASASVRGVSPDGVPLCSHGDDADACQLFHPPLDQDAADAAAFDRGWTAEHRRSVVLTRCGCGPEHGPQCTQGL